MSDAGNVYALILAGGVGTRLWPRSRRNRPKQLLSLVGEQSLLQMTVDRIRPIIPPERVFIMTNQEYVPAVRSQVPDVPAVQVIGEPAVRGTAPAIGLGAYVIQQFDPDGVMLSLHADHFFSDEEQFRRAMVAAAAVAGENWLVNLGVRPEYPATGYGYVELDGELGTYKDHSAYAVKQFTEKPDLETARRFVASDDYLWNSGIFCWRTDVILDAFSRLLPEHATVLERIAAAFGADDWNEVLAREWATLSGETTIDRGIMERADQVATVPMSAGWSDIGSWESLAELMPANDDENVIAGDVVAFDSRRVFAHSDNRFIALVGVEDLIVVDDSDAILVCHRSRAQYVKKIVKWLEQEGRDEML